MTKPKLDWRYAIASRLRANTATTVAALGLDPELVDMWVDTAAEVEAYQRSGYLHVLCTGTRGIQNARNAMLNHYGAGARIVTFCDDVKRVVKLQPGGKTKALNANELVDFIGMAFDQARANGSNLWSVYPIANGFYMKDRVSPTGFCIGTFSGLTVTDLRFDTRFALKEDYDFTLAHIVRDGRVSRFDGYAVEAIHYTNAGGCVDYRTMEKENDACRLLLEKYPGMVKRNSRRPGEVLIAI